MDSKFDQEPIVAPPTSMHQPIQNESEYEVNSHNEIEETKRVSKKLVLLVSFILALLIPASIYVYSKNKTGKIYNTTLAPTPVSKPTPTPASNAAIADPTANWKIYTNLNFRFLYDPTWTVKDQPCPDSGPYWGTTQKDCKSIQFSKKVLTNPKNAVEPASEFAYINLYYQSNPSNLDTQKWLDNNITVLDGFKPDKKYVSVDGETALQTSLPSMFGSNWTIFFHTNKMFGINEEEDSSESEKAVVALKPFILSTFKFTDSSASASPSPSCRPRPACLDATPRCMIPETSDMCPPASK